MNPLKVVPRPIASGSLQTIEACGRKRGSTKKIMFASVPLSGQCVNVTTISLSHYVLSYDLPKPPQVVPDIGPVGEPTPEAYTF